MRHKPLDSYEQFEALSQIARNYKLPCYGNYIQGFWIGHKCYTNPSDANCALLSAFRSLKVAIPVILSERPFEMIWDDAHYDNRMGYK